MRLPRHLLRHCLRRASLLCICRRPCCRAPIRDWRGPIASCGSLPAGPEREASPTLTPARGPAAGLHRGSAQSSRT
eukprot:7178314-Lingulodinium_polyedra.AAC.1